MAFMKSLAIDYNQPQISPYEQSRIVVITVGKRNYSIPKNYLSGHLLVQARQSQNPRILLRDVDADVGHTILHFLYKGEYETIFYEENQREKHQIELEYERSVQVYYAARKYKIDGLDALAQNYIITLSETLSIFQILRRARSIFSKLPENEEWFHYYLDTKISSSFAEGETTFQLDEFYAEIVDDPAFSKAVMKIIVKAFTTETSRLRNILRVTGGSETKNDGEPSCEQSFAVPQSEPTEGHDREQYLEVRPKAHKTANNSSSSTSDRNRPCGEPAVELLPVDCEEANPEVPYSHEDSDNWGWGFRGLDKKK
ncbi:uncharacterized protein AKAW2_50556S [Aspergillus luchuensis]|uniref:BTB domain-containing protein n=1 Tax=Aspergillus kawachii TaxID=1069201 RepID=A0A7R7WCF3_ASPKA|nr:uncharacterized protein AKAW2_50556S [Aspergillus luchuensis]BCS00215.1 hypothetical protein AKAW2_50556S [Aspergillus luchuensis]GAA93142.1 hypothetical protein AKAW_11254 [Aspergillus luchuensis IFO 4308]